MANERPYWSGKLERLLVGRSRFGKTEWLRLFRRLVVDLRSRVEDLENPARELRAGDIDPREPLLWAWCVLLAMPPSLLQDFRALKERGSDGSGIEDGLEEVRRARYLFEGLDTAHPMRLAWLARLVRALDADLSQIHYGPEGSRNERWTPEAWRVPGYPCYVIPINRSHRLRDGKPAVRRALCYHAILPARVGEHKVQLSLPRGQLPSPREAPLRDWTAGSAIFEPHHIEIEVKDGEFTVVGVVCAGQRDRLESALETARSSRCDVFMCPELTIPRAEADALAAKLRREALGDHHKMRLVVAGSWHLRTSTRVKARNVVPVFDGRGNLILDSDKRMKFMFDGLQERIAPGDRIDVIAAGDRLLALGICLDFCDDEEGAIYRALDVDTVLVPSMGGRTTIEAHERHAKELQTLHGATVLVVQQVPVRAGATRSVDEPPGYSAFFPKPLAKTGGAEVEVGAVRQECEFRTLDERRDRALDNKTNRT